MERWKDMSGDKAQGTEANQSRPKPLKRNQSLRLGQATTLTNRYTPPSCAALRQANLICHSGVEGNCKLPLDLLPLHDQVGSRRTQPYNMLSILTTNLACKRPNGCCVQLLFECLTPPQHTQPDSSKHKSSHLPYHNLPIIDVRSCLYTILDSA